MSEDGIKGDVKIKVRERTLQHLCYYLQVVYITLDADQLRQAAECGMVAAEDIAEEELK